MVILHCILVLNYYPANVMATYYDPIDATPVWKQCIIIPQISSIMPVKSYFTLLTVAINLQNFRNI